VIVRLKKGLFLLVVFWYQASISNGFRDINGECDAMIDMTLNDL